MKRIQNRFRRVVIIGLFLTLVMPSNGQSWEIPDTRPKPKTTTAAAQNSVFKVNSNRSVFQKASVAQGLALNGEELPFYELEVVERTVPPSPGVSVIVALGQGPSINDLGKAAFTTKIQKDSEEFYELEVKNHKEGSQNG
jgi:hypothetical protein